MVLKRDLANTLVVLVYYRTRLKTINPHIMNIYIYHSEYTHKLLYWYIVSYHLFQEFFSGEKLKSSACQTFVYFTQTDVTYHKIAFRHFL